MFRRLLVGVGELEQRRLGVRHAHEGEAGGDGAAAVADRHGDDGRVDHERVDGDGAAIALVRRVGGLGDDGAPRW